MYKKGNHIPIHPLVYALSHLRHCGLSVHPTNGEGWNLLLLRPLTQSWQLFPHWHQSFPCTSNYQRTRHPTDVNRHAVHAPTDAIRCVVHAPSDAHGWVGLHVTRFPCWCDKILGNKVKGKGVHYGSWLPLTVHHCSNSSSSCPHCVCSQKSANNECMW